MARLSNTRWNPIHLSRVPPAGQRRLRPPQAQQVRVIKKFMTKKVRTSDKQFDSAFVESCVLERAKEALNSAASPNERARLQREIHKRQVAISGGTKTFYHDQHSMIANRILRRINTAGSPHNIRTLYNDMLNDGELLVTNVAGRPRHVLESTFRDILRNVFEIKAARGRKV